MTYSDLQGYFDIDCLLCIKYTFDIYIPKHDVSEEIVFSVDISVPVRLFNLRWHVYPKFIHSDPSRRKNLFYSKENQCTFRGGNSVNIVLHSEKESILEGKYVLPLESNTSYTQRQLTYQCCQCSDYHEQVIDYSPSATVHTFETTGKKQSIVDKLN